tara:strand:- start:984 stop:2600 length:1617 start_codon:yes stop_codon:yes gene_type:complete
MDNKNINIKETFKLAIQNHKNNNFIEASNLYENILIHDPNHFDTNFYFGTLNLQKKNYVKACELFKKAAEINPNIVEVHNNLGLIYYNLKEIDKAKTCFNKSIEINSNHVQAYLNLGNVYKNLGEIEKAEKLYLDAININPNYFDAYNNLIILYERLNKHEDLKKIIIQANDHFKSNPIVKLFYGQYLYKTEKFYEAIEHLEQIEFREKLLNREMLRIEILAKSYDKIENIEKAYFYFQKINEIDLNNKSDNIDKNKTLKIIEKRKVFFNNNKIKEWPIIKSKDQNENPIFLIGFPRSGTTLLDNILTSHPSIQTIEEKPIVGNFVKSLGEKINNNFENLKNINENNIELFRKIYFDNREKYISNKNNSKIYIDKMPLNIIHVAEIVRVFPNAKFVLSLRHPCDCVFSCFMQSFKLNDAMSNFLDLEDAANLYNEVMTLWKQYINIFSVKYHIIKYEDLVLDFEKSAQKILKFLELSWSDNLFDFNKTVKNKGLISTPSYDQVNKPIYSRSIGRWKKYEKKISKIIPILKPWIKEFNY